MFLALLFTGSAVEARQSKGIELKATEVRIHKKTVLSEEERKAVDETISKGKLSAADKKVSVPTFWATGNLAVPLPDGGKRYAIVAGLANYSGTDYDLCVAASKTLEAYPTTGAAYYCQDYDSIHMQEALVGFEKIILLRDADATRANINLAMAELETLVTASDEVLFFFSGHGVSGKVTGDKETLDEALFTYDKNYVWDNELKLWIDALAPYRAVFVFDICLAGGMNDLVDTERVLAMSSGETQSSSTYSLGGATVDGQLVFSEGLFSHSFVEEGMNNLLADGNNALLAGDLEKYDGRVALEESFGYTYPIIKLTQTPVLNDRVTDDLIP